MQNLFQIIQLQGGGWAEGGSDVEWTGEEVDTLDLHSFVRTFAEDPDTETIKTALKRW